MTPPPERRIPPSRICFVHVPKAAGTSIIELLKRHLGPTSLYHAQNRDTRLVARLLRRHRFVAGHFFLRDFSADAFRDTYLFTTLRDPVERVLSQYRFFRQVHDVADDREVFLARHNDLADILRRPEYENNSRWVNALTTCFAGEGIHKIADRESLRKAKRHLRLLDLVGLQESFSETYSRLAEDLGWEKSEILFCNQTERQPGDENVDPQLRELIEKTNVLDRELYEEARALFASRHVPPANRQELLEIDGHPRESGTKEVFFERIEFVGRDYNSRIRPGDTITIRFHIVSRIDCPDLTIGIAIKDRTGLDIYGTNSWLHGQRLKVGRNAAINLELVMQSPQEEGWYTVVAALHPGRDSSRFCYQWLEEALRFYVEPAQQPEFVGVTNLHANFAVTGRGHSISPRANRITPDLSHPPRLGH